VEEKVEYDVYKIRLDRYMHIATLVSKVASIHINIHTFIHSCTRSRTHHFRQHFLHVGRQVLLLAINLGTSGRYGRRRGGHDDDDNDNEEEEYYIIIIIMKGRW
jgi:hypothetical protein